MVSNSYLLVPTCEEGNGTGHLRRMIDLYRKLKKSSLSSVFIPAKAIPEIHKKLLSHGVDPADLYTETLPETDLWDFIVVDYRDTPACLIDILQLKGILIGIDEGGGHRGGFEFLIDIIPTLPNPVKPNISATGLMDLPEKHLYDEACNDYEKILITFGGEDPKGLTTTLLDFIKINGYFHEAEITVVIGEKFVNDKCDGSIKFLVGPGNLKNILYEYDLIITSFGLTAFESLAAGVPFVLLNPSSYHHKLSLNCGFYEIGVIKPDKKKLDRFIQNGAEFMSLQRKYIPDEYIDLKDLVLSLNKSEDICPVCHHECEDKDLTHRFETRNFYNCPVCGITFQADFLHSRDSYKKEYFFEDYKKQYGCTYLEDFGNIQKFARSRLKIISYFKPSSINDETTLLDVGCAYGPFLVESAKYGYLPTGVEIIPEAARYVQSELGFQVLSGFFEDAYFEKPFDILTMWYVIEHFTDLKLILARVNRLLKPGGVFAFSTPNGSGITARKSMELFLKETPFDHISVWNPAITTKLLMRFGFRVKRIRVTGHHAERFPGLSKIKSKSGYKIMNFISKALNLGDTFEVYAEKMKEIDG